MIGQKQSQYIDIPKDIGKVKAATYLCLGSSQCIAAYNDRNLYFMEISDNMSVRYSTFAIKDITNLIALVKGYLLVISSDNKIWLMQVRKDQRTTQQLNENQVKQQKQKGLFIQCFLRDTHYTSFYIREVTANMVELQIYVNIDGSQNRSILIYQFTINQKVGVMGYTVDKVYKIVKTSRKQLYGSKIFYDPSRNHLIKFKNFSDSQLQLKTIQFQCLFVFPICKTEEYYGINKQYELVNFETSAKRKLKQLSHFFSTSKCHFQSYLNYFLIENLQTGKVYLYHFQQNLKVSLVHEQQAGYVWSIGFNGRLVGVDSVGCRIKVCNQSKPEQLSPILTSPSTLPKKIMIEENQSSSDFIKNQEKKYTTIIIEDQSLQKKQEKREEKKIFKPTKIISRNKVSVSKQAISSLQTTKQTLTDQQNKIKQAQKDQKVHNKIDNVQNIKQESTPTKNPQNNVIQQISAQNQISNNQEPPKQSNNSQIAHIQKVIETQSKQSENSLKQQKQAQLKEQDKTEQTSQKILGGHTFKTDVNSHVHVQSPFSKKQPFFINNNQQDFFKKIKKQPPNIFQNHTYSQSPFIQQINMAPTESAPKVPFSFGKNPFANLKTQIKNESKDQKIEVVQKISNQHACQPLFEKYTGQIQNLKNQMKNLKQFFDAKSEKIPQILQNSLNKNHNLIGVQSTEQSIVPLQKISAQLSKQTQSHVSDYMAKKLTTKVNSYFKHIMNDSKKIYDQTYKFYTDRKKQSVLSMQAHLEQQQHLINQIRQISGGLMLSVESSIIEGQQSHALMLKQWNSMKNNIEQKLDRNYQQLQEFMHQKSDSKKESILEQLATIKQQLKQPEQSNQIKVQKHKKTVPSNKKQHEVAKKYSKSYAKGLKMKNCSNSRFNRY